MHYLSARIALNVLGTVCFWSINAAAESVFESVFKANANKPVQYQGVMKLFSDAESRSAQAPGSDRSSCIHVMAPVTGSPFQSETDLKHPRTLRAFQINERPVFTGFVEKRNELEIISWNDQVRPPRFEFQLLHNVGNGKPPSLVPAKREFCMSCHQHGGPIFVAFPWTYLSRFDGDRRAIEPRNSEHLPEYLKNAWEYERDSISTSLLLAMRPQTHYQDMDLKEYAYQSANFLGAFDAAVRSGSGRLMRAQVCDRICGSDVECKRLVVRTAVYNTLGEPEDAFPGQSTFTAEAPSPGGRLGSLCDKSQSFTAPLYDKFEAFISPVDARDFTPFQSLFAGIEYPKLTSDLLSDDRPETIGVEERQFYAVKNIDADWVAKNAWGCLGLTEVDRQTLMKIDRDRILERVNSPAMTGLLQTWPPAREQTVAVLQGKQVSAPAAATSVVAAPSVSVEQAGASVGQKATSLFQKNCALCHQPGENVPYPLPLDSLSGLKSYRSKREGHVSPLDRLMRNEMPPEGFRKPEFVQDRCRMIEALAGKISDEDKARLECGK